MSMRFEVLPAVKMSMLVFWVVKPYGLVGRDQRFGGTYCLHLQVCRLHIVITSYCKVSNCLVC
jgi:hypothetical protein